MSPIEALSFGSISFSLMQLKKLFLVVCHLKDQNMRP